MSKVSVIIPTWNGRQFLQNCLDSLLRQTYQDFETILVDNGSSDGTAPYVREHYPWVKLVVLTENIGFSGGNNRGLQECSGEHIVTLNNDTRTAPDFLAELVKAVEADTTIGMVAAKMLNFHQKGRIDSIGINATTSGMGQNIGVGEQDTEQHDTPVEPFGACAGAALYRRKMLDETGFFDEDFFAYYEDLDLAWRGRLSGWRAVKAPGAVVQHIHSATGGRMSTFTVYHVHRNKWYVLLKNWPMPLILKHLHRIILQDLGSLILATLRGRLAAALRARLRVLGDLPAIHRKRQAVQSLRKVPVSEIERLLTSGSSMLQVFVRKMGSGV